MELCEQGFLGGVAKMKVYVPPNFQNLSLLSIIIYFASIFTPWGGGGGSQNEGLCPTNFLKLVPFVHHTLPCINSHSVLFILNTPYRDFILILRQVEGVCLCVCGVCVWGQRILGMEAFKWRNI